MKTHCRKWVWGYCDCLGISFIFRLTTFDDGIRRQKPSNGENRMFHFTLNKGYIGKAIFSSSFSARYHILKKKKKKKKILGLCRCSVGNYSLTSGDLPCQFELLSHTCGWWALTQCCFNDGPHFQRSGDGETVLFQCITFITFRILDQTSSNLQGSRHNGCQWCVQNYMWSGWELTEISTKDAPPALLHCWLSVVL